jgi:hypothetical protein
MTYTIIKKSFTSLSITVLILTGISCKKFIEVTPSPDLIKTSLIFEDEKTAVSAVIGLYIDMRNVATYFTNGGMSIYGGLSADEIYNTTTSATYDPFLSNSLLSNNGTIYTNFWTIAFKNIYRINTLLEGIATSNNLSSQIENQLKGELLFARAFHYFYLVNLFSDVPLITGTDYKVNQSKSRTTKQEVYEQITKDLIEAEGLLSVSYTGTYRARPNKLTAASLLTRVYLYTNNWTAAETEATSIINSAAYSIVLDLNKVFVKESAEIIWQIAPLNEESNTAQGASYIPATTTTKPTFAITNQLMSSFEAGDKRVVNWMKSNTVAGTSYYYPYKYKVRTSSTPVSEYNIVFRLAEIYLIRAEARAYKNNLTDSKADLNIIRSRAGLGNTIAASQTDLVEAIQHERQVELFTEWGDRWLNLKRTLKANTVLAPIKGSNWQDIDALYPIPFQEIEYNPFLIQNPGY